MTARLEGPLHDTAQEAVLAAKAPGGAVALRLGGIPILETAVGHADLTGTIPLEPEAVFYVYSITKTLIAAAVLGLEEKGRLGLDDPLTAHLPDLELPAPVTIRQALRHSGGLPDYGALPAYGEALRRDPARPWSEAEFLERSLACGMSFTPDRGWAYSNVGYMLLKRLLERLCGQSLAAALHARLFSPLGLARTFVARSLEDAAPLTPGYGHGLRHDGVLENVAPRYHPGWVAHGVVASSAPELARLVEALFAGELVSAATRARMRETVLAPGSHPLFNETRYGLGLMVDPASRHGEMAGHNGGGPGYSASAFHFTSVAGHEVTGAVLLNRDAGGDLAQGVLLAVVDRLAEALRAGA